MDIGTQIAYIPNHAEGEITHPDTEFGFVTSWNEDPANVFCRFWAKGWPGTLRTTSCSESTPKANLVEHESVFQERVEEELIRLGYKSTHNSVG